MIQGGCFAKLHLSVIVVESLRVEVSVSCIVYLQYNLFEIILNFAKDSLIHLEQLFTLLPDCLTGCTNDPGIIFIFLELFPQIMQVPLDAMDFRKAFVNLALFVQRIRILLSCLFAGFPSRTDCFKRVRHWVERRSGRYSCQRKYPLEV
jgi:hypothetical protein